MTEAREPAGPNGETHARHTPGTPCWVSLMVHGLTAAQDFYGALFGWEFQPGPDQLGPYSRALLDGYEVAGIGRLPTDRHLPIAWTPYLASDDVDATAETVRLCGGTIGVGPLDSAEAGRLAIGSDPSGAVFGIWQAAGHHGTAITGVPGTPAWNELLTFESVSVAKFYETVFGYEEEPVVSADFDYVTLHIEGRPVAGIHGVGHALPVTGARTGPRTSTSRTRTTRSPAWWTWGDTSSSRRGTAHTAAWPWWPIPREHASP